MMNEGKRVLAVVLVALTWFFITVLNVQGFFVEVTKVLFYLLGVVYLILVIPDIVYFFKKKPVDAFGRLTELLRNIHRFFFVGIFLLVTSELGLSLYFLTGTHIESNLIQCSHEAIIESKGVLLVKNFKLRNLDFVEYEIWTVISMERKWQKVRIKKSGKFFECGRRGSS